jgi:flagellar biosynthesis component FlhA
MAKVQMFFFTLIIAFSYMVLLVNLIMTKDATELNSFPELSDGLVALLGISAAGYLANKPGDKTKTVPKP